MYKICQAQVTFPVKSDVQALFVVYYYALFRLQVFIGLALQ